MTLVEPIREAASLLATAPPRTVHRAKIELAKLALSEAPPQAVNQLELAERFLHGAASSSELASAKTDVWTYIGSLACYCTVSDSASAQAVLCCLETDDGHHTAASLLEQAERVSRCRVDAERITAVLRRVAEQR